MAETPGAKPDSGSALKPDAKPDTPKPDATPDASKTPDSSAPPSAPAPAAAAAPPTAPERYTLSLPEGAHLDSGDLAAFERFARTNNWTNQDAQQVLEEHAAALQAQSAHYRAELEKDPIYGGANLMETERLCNLALDRLRPRGTPAGDEIRRALVKTGWGNYKPVVALFADIGRMMAEDKTTGALGFRLTPEKPNPADALFPTTVGVSGG
ncbi:MAG TPA: hypothetical protein VKB41_05030 [Steroidobacteraceae bacterium]|nr:hypothetical protein [Steroidobacteraceae bacterium]